MSHQIILSAIDRVEKNFGKKYEPEMRTIICNLLLDQLEPTLKEIILHVIGECKFLPKKQDFLDAMARVGSKARSAKINIKCEWCGSTGKVDAYHNKTFAEITLRCSCRAGQNFSQNYPTFGEWKLKYNYTLLKHGELAPETVRPIPTGKRISEAKWDFGHPELVGSKEKEEDDFNGSLLKLI